MKSLLKLMFWIFLTLLAIALLISFFIAIGYGLDLIGFFPDLQDDQLMRGMIGSLIIGFITFIVVECVKNDKRLKNENT